MKNLKQITEATITPSELEAFLFTKTRTRGGVNTTAVNALSLALAANSVNTDKVNKLRGKLMADSFKSAEERIQVISDIESAEIDSRTFSFDQLATFIVEKLKITSAYHKKDGKVLTAALDGKPTKTILSDKTLKGKCIKLTARRIRNHTSHHIFQTKRYREYFSMDTTTSDYFTVLDRSLEIILNHQVRSHVKALTKEVRK